MPLDIRRIAHEGLLRKGISFTWAWTSNYGDPVGNISVHVRDNPEHLVLSYRVTPYGEAAKAIECHVAIERTACHFGGKRPWFVCPKCWRRNAVLYFGGLQFACRRCLRVGYACQAEDVTDRLWRKRRKIEKRLAGGAGEWNQWQRPKGMHQTTFSQLRGALADVEIEQDRVFCAQVTRLMQMLRL